MNANSRRSNCINCAIATAESVSSCLEPDNSQAWTWSTWAMVEPRLEFIVSEWKDSRTKMRESTNGKRTLETANTAFCFASRDWRRNTVLSATSSALQVTTDSTLSTTCYQYYSWLHSVIQWAKVSGCSIAFSQKSLRSRCVVSCQNCLHRCSIQNGPPTVIRP